MSKKLEAPARRDRTRAGYSKYVRELRSLVTGVVRDGLTGSEAQLHTALNGGADSALRKLVPLQQRRDLGQFFTGAELRSAVASSVAERGFTRESVFLDPSCGAGDLLLSIAEGFGVHETLTATVNDWGRHLAGRDLDEGFTEAAKLRLVALAATKCKILDGPIDHETAFPDIRVGDGLSAQTPYGRAHVIVLNPPFGPTVANRDTDWASGRVSLAAFFLLQAIDRTRPGTKIVAVLPDVLRSGTRYKKWRSLVEDKSTAVTVDLHGRFDDRTDVDVFLLGLVVGSPNPSSTEVDWWRQGKAVHNVGDFFEVRVGSVVPHRHPKLGPWHPYISSRRLPQGGVFEPSGHHRRFDGTVFKPPFVAVRRTSKPGDLNRGAGVLITGKRSVAVENHLLVLKPNDGRLESCLALMKVLSRSTSADWLDTRIRCRHLTVSALREVPWEGRDR